MPKRKATNRAERHNNIIPEDEEVNSNYAENTLHSQNVLRETQLDDSLNNKRKRVSQGLNDLSDLNDIQTQSKLAQDKIPCSGVIENVFLKNFKCHSMLDFTFHPYINFLLGRNGSGKSAVMDAVILCLGGRANSTGRQAAARTFIKTNTDKAELRVTLRNDGEEPYLPNVYGSRITIERKITKDTSTYRILNDRNKLISTKKSEIENITEQFNIQVENPVCFLNQETSKHFLNTSNKSTKYNFFMKASQLDSFKSKQELAESTRKSCVEILKDKQTYIPRLDHELFEWEEKYKRCQSVDKLRKKHSLLVHEYAWAVVISFEKIVEEERKNMQGYLKTQEKTEKKLEESKDSLEKVNQEYKTIKEKISELTDQSKIVKNEFETANETYKKVAAKHKTVTSETKRLTVFIDKKTKEKDGIKKRLEQEKNIGEKDYEVERRQKEEKIQNIEEKLKEKLEMEKEKIQEYRNFCQELDNSQKSFDEKKHHLKNVDGLIKRLNEDIENLGKSANDQIYRYGNSIAIIVKDINAHYQNRKFKEKPIGPIGMYIQPKDDRYSLAIESCLGGVLTNFICSNQSDEQVLRQIIDKHIKDPRQKPSIVVTDFSDARYDVSRFNRDFPEHPTVYDMLNIRDNVVANVLIDQKRIETVLLLPDYETARDIIERKSTTNFNQAYTPNGDQYLGKPSFKFYASQSTESRYFIKSTEAAIQSKRNEIAKLTEDMAMAHQAVRKVNEDLSKNKQLKQQSEHQTSLLKKEINNLKIKLDEAKNIHIPEPANLAVFEDEINRLEMEINGFREQIQNIENNSGASMAEFENATNEKQRCDLKWRELQENIETITESIRKIETDRSSKQEAVKHYQKILDDQLTKVAKSQDLICDQEKELEKITNAALETSQRVETKKTTKAIELEMANVEKQIKQNEKLHGDEEEISRNYLERREKLKKVKADIKKQELFLKKLKDTILVREQRFINLIESKALRCALHFNSYLRSRNYNGNLKFDHKLQTLDVNVHPNQSKDSHEERDLKSLSGGERSFSTVAFLLSLWSIVESPILFLDEFDVFMDQVNRKIVMELLLASAKEKLNGQYVFLTPQEMGYVNQDEHVRVYKMPDPKRSIDEVDENDENNE